MIMISINSLAIMTSMKRTQIISLFLLHLSFPPSLVFNQLFPVLCSVVLNKIIYEERTELIKMSETNQRTEAMLTK